MELQNAVITEVVDLVTICAPKGRYVEMKNRSCYGLTFCMDEGQITYTQNGVKYTENNTHAVLLPQGKSYSLYNDSAGNFFVINFHSLYPLSDTIKEIEVKNTKYLTSCYMEMKKLHSMGKQRAKVLSLFYEILNELTNQELSDILSPALEYIHESYFDSEITNKSLARKCKISEVYFRKLFKEKYDISPKQYILSLRLDKAKKLLCEGEQKIHEIALACGFESSEHFCRSFKAQLGTTPGNYRKQNRIIGI
ncbi:MAG: helix-turn-helix transcriptional regulator [Clostridia bacterium]|nr:helix-turn-helix transcriptional regulator [Clostridia bacterium]